MVMVAALDSLEDLNDREEANNMIDDDVTEREEGCSPRETSINATHGNFSMLHNVSREKSPVMDRR